MARPLPFGRLPCISCAPQHGARDRPTTLSVEVRVRISINLVRSPRRSLVFRSMIPVVSVIALAVMTPLSHTRASAQTQTNTVLLSPIDTYINLNDENYVSAATIATYTWPNTQAANAILMKFDLSALPPGAVVQRARIRMNLVEADTRNGTTYTIPVHKIIGRNPDLRAASGSMATASAQWAPSSCCYNGIPLAQGNISPAYTSTAVDKTLGVKWWTATNLVQEWIADPSTNYGLLLNADTTVLKDRYRYFASMEYPDPTLRP